LLKSSSEVFLVLFLTVEVSLFDFSGEIFFAWTSFLAFTASTWQTRAVILLKFRYSSHRICFVERESFGPLTSTKLRTCFSGFQRVRSGNPDLKNSRSQFKIA